MTYELAFVGDVHGNLDALRGLWDVLADRRGPHVVFLGDYINKGPQSAEVVQELIEHAQNDRATLLAGNHEEALLHALDSGDLSAFLKMGGAMTIRSYVGGPVGPDVLPALRDRLPNEHVDVLRSMPKRYESNEFIAQHVPPAVLGKKFSISAHIPVGNLPRISRDAAHLDTGCGNTGGRLTALLWPSREYLQVDAQGTLLADGSPG